MTKRLKRWETMVAVVASIASIAASGASITKEVTEDEPAGGGRTQTEQVASCAAMLDDVMDFAEEHPAAARVYAKVGPSGKPKLAAQPLIDACGDPETLLEEQGVVPKP
jgi:hypothetical protein